MSVAEIRRAQRWKCQLVDLRNARRNPTYVWSAQFFAGYSTNMLLLFRSIAFFGYDCSGSFQDRSSVDCVLKVEVE
ncbi:hypothetical protein GYMLUDRAFT_579930 [Collybiopsis luxurians FD-317 M1]|uniref:Uncharacterized protein n=1 Tax=Collybiopsis luxurians FD-317 M1 TaxID=944289 RepID=A0A0D0BZH5_9AGAR|nr:hypothetical protein GYMLUDRAFT_579930 [Collybiopsis luxurians FD-317 M1]